MRQLNFLLFFALCLGLALFSIENTQTAAINLVPGVQIEAPLSIELLIAVGTGAMLAWIFSLWDQLQRQIDSWKAQRELKLQGEKIKALEQALSELQGDGEDEIAEVEGSMDQDLTLAESESADGESAEPEASISESTTADEEQSPKAKTFVDLQNSESAQGSN